MLVARKMRLQKPTQATIDQVRTTREGNDAIIDYTDVGFIRRGVRTPIGAPQGCKRIVNTGVNARSHPTLRGGWRRTNSHRWRSVSGDRGRRDPRACWRPQGLRLSVPAHCPLQAGRGPGFGQGLDTFRSSQTRSTRRPPLEALEARSAAGLNASPKVAWNGVGAQIGGVRHG